MSRFRSQRRRIMLSLKKVGTSALAIGIATLWCSGALASAPKYTLKLGCGEVATAAVCKGMEVFKSYVEAASGGEVRADVYAASQLGDPPELYEGIKSGLYQVTQGDESITGFYEPMVVLSIPYLFSNELVVAKFFESDYFKRLNDGFAKKTGVRIIGFGISGFRSFTNGRRPIKSVDDMKGLKIRVQPIPVMLTLVKYYANEKWWQTLPAGLKSIILTGARLGGSTETGLRLYENRVSAPKDLEKKGMDVYMAPQSLKDQFRAVAQPAVVDVLKKQVGADVVDGALKAVKDIEAEIAVQTK
jgi:TRAP-type C4-dicarboxylate transport system substrate-binding protein